MVVHLQVLEAEYDIDPNTVIGYLFTQGFSAWDGILVGHSNIMFRVDDVSIQNTVRWKGRTMEVDQATSALSINEWRGENLLIKGNTFAKDPGAESDIFTMFGDLQVDGQLYASEVRCSGFHISNGKLYGEDDETELVWPDPGDSVNASTDAAEVLGGGMRIPFIGNRDRPLDCPRNVSVGGACRNVKACGRGFACVGERGIVVGTCRDRCCSRVKLSDIQSDDGIVKMEVSSSFRIVVLDNKKTVRVYEQDGDLIEELYDVDDIDVVGDSVVFMAQGDLQLWRETKSIVLARGVTTFAVNEYRGRLVVASDCMAPIVGDDYEIMCTGKVSAAGRVTKKETFYIADNRLIVCHGTSCATKLQIDPTDRVTTYFSKDQRPILAIRSNTSVTMRKLLRTGELTHFQLTQYPIDGLSFARTTDGLFLMFTSASGNVQITHCSNDICMPNIVW